MKNILKHRIYNSIVWNLRGLYRIFRTKYFPWKCEGCGAKLHYSYPGTIQYELGSFMVQNIGKKLLCRDCICKEIEESTFTNEEYFKYRDDWKCGTCKLSGEKVESYKFACTPNLVLLFCLQAWNWHYFSKKEILRCIRFGAIRTSRCILIGGRLRSTINGVPIDKQGKPLKIG